MQQELGVRSHRFYCEAVGGAFVLYILILKFKMEFGNASAALK